MPKRTGNTISDFRFALGAVGPVVLRLTQAEELVMQGAPRKQILEAAGEVIVLLMTSDLLRPTGNRPH